MGYFLWLNERIVTTNAANAIATINASNTDTAPRAHTKWVMQTLPHDAVNLVCPQNKVSQPPLSYLCDYFTIIPHICSILSNKLHSKLR